jgi:hypothetical protein
VREAAGDRFEQLEFHAYAADLIVTDAGETALDELCQRDGISREEAIAVPGTLVGSIQNICEQLEAWRERAFVSYLSSRQVDRLLILRRRRRHRRRARLAGAWQQHSSRKPAVQR